MIESYEAATRHLIENGWHKENPGGFKKGGYEIVFDTSHYVELYDATGERIAEAPIKSLEDIINFLNTEINGQATFADNISARRALIPKSVEVIGGFLIVIAILAPISLLIGLVSEIPIHIHFFGSSYSGQALAIQPFIFVFLFLILGLSAASLLLGKKWGPVFCITSCLISLIISLFFSIQNQLTHPIYIVWTAILIFYMYKVNKIKFKWRLLD